MRCEERSGDGNGNGDADADAVGASDEVFRFVGAGSPTSWSSSLSLS